MDLATRINLTVELFDYFSFVSIKLYRYYISNANYDDLLSIILIVAFVAVDPIPDFTENQVDWEKLSGAWSDVSSNEALLGKCA